MQPVTNVRAATNTNIHTLSLLLLVLYWQTLTLGPDAFRSVLASVYSVAQLDTIM